MTIPKPNLTANDVDTKMREGLKMMDGKYLMTNHFGMLEIESIRSFFSAAFNKVRDLSVS